MEGGRKEGDSRWGAWEREERGRGEGGREMEGGRWKETIEGGGGKREGDGDEEY